MHIKKALLLTVIFGGAAAFAGTTYKVDLFKPITVNGTQLKAGEYKLEVLDNKVIFKQGKKTTEAAVKVEQGTQKFASTSVLAGDDGQPQEIRISGTTTKIIFDKTDAKKTDENANGSK